jgi:ribosomal RNA-processing protein 8
VSDGEWVVEADCCKSIPLPGSEEEAGKGGGRGGGGQVVDLAICSLSLMNTNWIRCVREARRVLKDG